MLSALNSSAIVWGDGAWKGRFAKVDGEVSSLQMGSDNTLAKWKKAPPLKAKSLAFAAWQSEFFAFVKEWGEFKDTNPWATDANDAILQTYEKRIYALRVSYDKLSETEPVPVPPVDPYEPPAKESSFGGLAWLGAGLALGVGVALVARR